MTVLKYNDVILVLRSGNITPIMFYNSIDNVSESKFGRLDLKLGPRGLSINSSNPILPFFRPLTPPKRLYALRSFG